MCINKKRFYNKWTHSWQWSDCGHCSACLQAKANKRTFRIKNATYDGYVTLFVTLTYRNINIPYIRKDEIHENTAKINIYRDCTVRRVRSSSNYDISYKYIRKTVVVHQYDCFKNRLFPNQSDVRKLPKLQGQGDSNKVGVIFYKDVQDFEKRLRINLQRHYNIEKPIYSFKCAEYGPSTHRSHFHLLISVPQESLAQCKSAIIEAWPYDSRVQSDKSIQVARNAASYVSSYVNCGSDFPKFLGNKGLCPKHSFSKGYGLQNIAFTLERITDSINRGSMQYMAQSFKAAAGFDTFVYPKYALNRYFSKCYGYSRLSYDEIINLAKDPNEFVVKSDLLPRLFQKTESDGLTHKLKVNFTGDYDYDFDKVAAFVRQFIRLRSRFCHDFVYTNELGQKVMGLPENQFSYELFGDYYYRCWRSYASTLYRQSVEQVTDVFQLPFVYENLDEVYNKRFRSDVLQYVDGVDLKFKEHFLQGVYSEPNLFVRNINQSIKLKTIFDNKYKRRKITNRVMCDNNFNV